MGETRPRTDGASFTMEPMPFLNDHENECPERGVSAMLAGQASSTRGDGQSDVVGKSREESLIQESLFSYLDFSTSFPSIQRFASTSDMISSVLTQFQSASPQQQFPEGASEDTDQASNVHLEPSMEKPRIRTMSEHHESAMDTKNLNQNCVQ